MPDDVAPGAAGLPLDLITVLRKLYASEVNVSIESDWDNGYTVGFGNQRNGITVSEHFDASELDRAAEWLDDKAR